MKLQELRQLLGQADKTLLEKAFGEVYKQLKKGQKEDTVWLQVYEYGLKKKYGRETF